MNKQILSIIAIFTFMAFSATSTLAYTEAITPIVAQGINKYKRGNYTGCIQDLNTYLKQTKRYDNQVVAYYLGMAYTQAGKKDEATAFYNRTIQLNPNNTLGKYAKRGVACIIGDPACNAPLEAKKQQETLTELDRFVRAPYGNGLSSDLNKELERQRLERVRKEMNSNDELNKYEFKGFKDFSNKKSSIEMNTIKLLNEQSSKLASNQPTDEEVLNAIRILNDAGLGNIAKQAEMAQQAQNSRIETTQKTQEVTSEYKPDVTREEFQRQMQRDMMTAQMAQYSQPNVGMLFGDKNANNNNNNNMMNMLPFLMAQQAQQQAGQNGGQQNNMQFTPEMLQTMMFSQMMPNLDFNSGNNN